MRFSNDSLDGPTLLMYAVVIDSMRSEVFMKRPCSEGRMQYRSNLRSARRLWPNQLHRIQIKSLEILSMRYSLSVPAGDLSFLDGRWYVTHAGLLGLARRNHCSG